MSATTYTLKSGHEAETGAGVARVTVDGHTFDLAGLVRTDIQITDAQWAALVQPEKATDARVGQVAWVRALGCFRRGVVTKVGRKNITVAVTTQGALDESVRYGRAARIQETAAACQWVRLEVPPATPEPAPAQEAQEEMVERGPIDRTAILTHAPIDSLMNSGAVEDPRDAYFTKGCGADVLARDAALIAQDQADTAGASAPAVPAPEAGSNQDRDRVVPKDVVTIHKGGGGDRYRVLSVTRGPDSQVRIEPVCPAANTLDIRGPFWVAMDLIHRVPVAARLTTVEVAEHQRLSDDPVQVEGPGWDPSRGAYRQVATVDAPGSRLPFAVLLPWPGGRIPSVAVLRIGDAIVVDGRCYEVVWDGGPAEAHLEPASWRDR